MRDPLKTGYEHRLQAAADAKKALVEKLRPKPAVADPDFDQRADLRAAELTAVRQARAEAREAARLGAAQRVADDESAALELKRGARKERKVLSKAEAQAKRDARYAARKARR